MAGTTSTEYTLEQVAEANTPEKLWIVIHGKVYNVSSYLDDHPGGRDVLMEVAGTDASADFDFVGHSSDAIKSLTSLEVGSLRGYRAVPKREAKQLVQRLERPLSPSSRFNYAIESLSKKGIATKICISLFALVPPALYYTAGANNSFLGHGSAIAVSGKLWLILALVSLISMGLLVTVWYRFWHRIFYYKGVFEYPPYVTLQ